MKFFEFNEKEKRVDIFNERHYPRKIGDKIKWYRNVTTILGIIDKGYQFDEWLKNVGHNAEIIIDKAGTFGTTFHHMVELFLHGNEISYYDTQEFGVRTSTELWERLNLWFNFWQEMNDKYKVEYKPEGIEYITYSDEHEFAGTIDLVCRLDGEPVIMDWKTGSYIGDKEHLQLTAYMQTLGIKRGFLIHLPAEKPNKKGYRITEVEYRDENFELFLATKKVFDFKNKDLPKVLTLPLTISKQDIKEKQ